MMVATKNLQERRGFINRISYLRLKYIPEMRITRVFEYGQPASLM